MAFWHKLMAKLAPSTDSAQLDDRPTSLIYVVLPEPLEPLDRGSRYEDPLEAELNIADVGFVSGGGSSLGEERADGTREIEHCGIDVDAFDVDAARELLRSHLPALGCLAGTQLQYRDETDVALQDEFDGAEWQLGQPRTAMHPGFGI